MVTMFKTPEEIVERFSNDSMALVFSELELKRPRDDIALARATILKHWQVTGFGNAISDLRLSKLKAVAVEWKVKPKDEKPAKEDYVNNVEKYAKKEGLDAALSKLTQESLDNIFAHTAHVVPEGTTRAAAITSFIKFMTENGLAIFLEELNKATLVHIAEDLELKFKPTITRAKLGTLIQEYGKPVEKPPPPVITSRTTKAQLLKRYSTGQLQDFCESNDLERDGDKTDVIWRILTNLKPPAEPKPPKEPKKTKAKKKGKKGKKAAEEKENPEEEVTEEGGEEEDANKPGPSDKKAAGTKEAAKPSANKKAAADAKTKNKKGDEKDEDATSDEGEKQKNAKAQAVTKKAKTSSSLAIQLKNAKQQSAYLCLTHILRPIAHLVDPSTLIRLTRTCKMNYNFLSGPEIWKTVYAANFHPQKRHHVIFGHEDVWRGKPSPKVEEEEPNELDCIVWGCGHLMPKFEDVAKCPSCDSSSKVDWKRAYREAAIANQFHQLFDGIDYAIGSSQNEFAPFFIYGDKERSAYDQLFGALTDIAEVSTEDTFSLEEMKVLQEEIDEDMDDREGEEKVRAAVKTYIKKIRDPRYGFAATRLLHFGRAAMCKTLMAFGITHDESIVGLKYTSVLD